VFRVLNGGLLVPAVVPLRKALLEEASRVFLAYLADRIEVGEEVKRRFSPEVLEMVVLRMTAQTAQNKSSMFQDVDAERETEVRYINGWFVAKGREFGLDVDTHRTLMELVEQRAIVKMEDIGGVFLKAKEFM
jgi:2-dehydropantoate 2-reductase